jgi:hypothetical protein
MVSHNHLFEFFQIRADNLRDPNPGQPPSPPILLFSLLQEKTSILKYFKLLSLFILHQQFFYYYLNKNNIYIYIYIYIYIFFLLFQLLFITIKKIIPPDMKGRGYQTEMYGYL